MKHFLCLILCLVLLCACCVTAFAESEVEVVDEDYYTKFQGQDISISVYNWGEYISDGSDGLLDVNAAFEELTGIRVLYTTFATNEELYGKIKKRRHQLRYHHSFRLYGCPYDRGGHGPAAEF